MNSTLEDRDESSSALKKNLELSESLKIDLEKEVKALKDASHTSTQEVQFLMTH
jgi:hypothetical protein